jgi:hypothetical protein
LPVSSINNSSATARHQHVNDSRATETRPHRDNALRFRFHFPDDAGISSVAIEVHSRDQAIGNFLLDVDANFRAKYVEFFAKLQFPLIRLVIID